MDETSSTPLTRLFVAKEYTNRGVRHIAQVTVLVPEALDLDAIAERQAGLGTIVLNQLLHEAGAKYTIDDEGRLEFLETPTLPAASTGGTEPQWKTAKNTPKPVLKSTSPSEVERQVHDLLTNPGDWWDNRAHKTNQKSPDFKHKTTGYAIWMHSLPGHLVEAINTHL